MRKIGVLGSGDVGRTLAAGFKTHGYETRIASRTPAKLADFTASSGIAAGTLADVAEWGDALVLSVHGSAAEAVLGMAGVANVRDKLVIDTTNPISDEPPVDGVLQSFTPSALSLMEQLQVAFPRARLVKAFNSVGSDRMVNPSYKNGPPTMFYCGNHPDAKAATAAILEQFGWEPADMGSAIAARAIEPLSVLWCIPGFRQNSWTHAFKVLWD